MFTKVSVDPEIEKMVMEFVDILNQRHTELGDLIKKLEKRLDKLEKEPKVINNYHILPNDRYYPPPYWVNPTQIWYGTSTENKV